MYVVSEVCFDLMIDAGSWSAVGGATGTVLRAMSWPEREAGWDAARFAHVVDRFRQGLLASVGDDFGF
jgi:hypothetical protein